MTRIAAHTRRVLALALALGATTASGCDEYGDDDDGSSRTYACVYDYSVYRQSEYGSSFDSYSGECITVSSEDECDAYTESSTECAGTSCADYSYSNVSVFPGDCDGSAGEGDDEGGEAGGGYGGDASGCEYTYDGECDEPEGTDICDEGTDSYDCSDDNANSCRWAYDGECDESEGTDLCPEGTDSSDC